MTMSTSRIFSGLLAIACASAAVAQPLPLSLNLPAAYADTKAAMLAGDADIVCIGDSLTFRPGAYFPFFSNRMRSKYGDGGEGFRAVSPWTAGSFDPGWNFGFINADDWPYIGFDGMWAGLNGYLRTSANLTGFSAIARLYYQTQPQGGTFSVERVGEPVMYIGTNALSSGFGINEFAVPTTGPGSLIIRPYSGSPNDLEEIGGEQQRPIEQGGYLLYGINWKSGQPGVRVHRAANGGWGVENFIRRGDSFTSIMRDIDPDLIIIMLGQNDGRLTASIFASRMNVLLDRLQVEAPNAEVVLVSTYRSNSQVVAALAPGLVSVAEQRGLGFINLRDAGGDYQSYIDRGFLDLDLLHFNDAGGRYVANLVFDALETGGASLNASCNDVDFNNNNVFPEDQDVIDFFNVLAGGNCPTAVGTQPGCDSIDFNRNGVFPEDQDVIAYFNVLAGGEC